MSGCQGTWSKKLDGKELHGAAGGNLEPRESTVSCTSSTQRQNINSPSIYECVVMLFFKWVVF